MLLLQIDLRLWVQKCYRTAENRSASLLPYRNGSVLLKRVLRLRYRTEKVLLKIGLRLWVQK
jgi:hypothetical protein